MPRLMRYIYLNNSVLIEQTIKKNISASFAICFHSGTFKKISIKAITTATSSQMRKYYLN